MSRTTATPPSHAAAATGRDSRVRPRKGTPVRATPRARQPVRKSAGTGAHEGARTARDVVPAKRTAPAAPAGGAIAGFARGVRTLAGAALGVASSAADLSLQLAAARLPTPGQRAAARSAGAMLRRMRESAGLSLKDLGHAIDLQDPALLALVEEGKIALPFELVLRLTAALGKNDPIPFLLRLTRTHNPEIWATLERLGIGRLVVQAGREREFANIYRASDPARDMSDAEFAAVLAFTRSAFEAAMRFRGELGRARAGSARRAPATRKRIAKGSPKRDGEPNAQSTRAKPSSRATVKASADGEPGQGE